MLLNKHVSSVVISSILLALVLIFGVVGSAQAAEFLVDETVIIPADEVVFDDLFINANRIEVYGDVKGDLFATGTEVIVDGNVDGSLAIAGQTLSVNGTVGGSLYSGAYALTLGPGATIGRNLYYGGFSLKTDSGSAVGRGLYFGGYQATLDGDVTDDVAVGGGALELGGTVGGDVFGSVGSQEQGAPPVFMPSFPGSVPMIQPGLRVGPSAQIGGQLDVDETSFETPESGREQPSILLRLGRALARRAGEFITLLIVGGLMLRLWPVGIEVPGQEAEGRVLESAGWGCLVSVAFVVGVPVVAGVIFLLALLGGLVTFGQLFSDILGLGVASLGLVVTVFVFVVSVVTKAVVAFLVGRMLLDRLSPQEQPSGWRDFASLALGALIYEIIRVIPFLGWLVGILVTLVGLGAIFFALRNRWQVAPEPSPPPAEAPA